MSLGENLPNAMVAFLAYAYPYARVPLSVLQMDVFEPMNVNKATAAAALRLAEEQGLLNVTTVSGAKVVSLTESGRKRGREYLSQYELVLEEDLSEDARQLLEQLKGAFEAYVIDSAKKLARQSGSASIEPLHLVIAAQTMTSGPLAEVVKKIDQERDKSRDRETFAALLKAVFRGRHD